MASPAAEYVFTSCACNSISGVLDFAKPHIAYSGPPTPEEKQIVVAYAAHHYLALATREGEVVDTLQGHRDKIQCLAWLDSNKVLVSGSVDGTVRVWARQPDQSWTCTARLCTPISTEGGANSSDPSSSSINKLTVLHPQQYAASDDPGPAYICASTLSKVLVWTSISPFTSKTWQLSFTCRLPSTQIPLSLALVPLCHHNTLLLVGAADTKIHAWQGRPNVRHGHEDASYAWEKAGALTGHQGWVRALSWRPLLARGGEVEKGCLLASGSQDGRIRVWKLESVVGVKHDHSTVNAQSEDAIEREVRMQVGLEGLALNGHANGNEVREEEEDHEARLMLSVDSSLRYRLRLDALLIGHDDWVTGLEWHPPVYASQETSQYTAHTDRKSIRPLALLSCSMDRSLIVWRPEGEHGVWSPCLRMGDLGADIGGAVAGNLLGFLGCVWSETGDMILAHGFGGCFWAYEKVSGKGAGGNVGLGEDGCHRRTEDTKHGDDTIKATGQIERDRKDYVAEGANSHLEEENCWFEEGTWRAKPFATGHFEAVTDLQWEPHGRYLVSVSKDQTTRLWGPTREEGGRYREMSRVQVHGYELSCVDMLRMREHGLISGADEKVIRVFEATNQVVGILREQCGITSQQPVRTETAYLPALGLSTKAVDRTQIVQANFEKGGDDAEAAARVKAAGSWQATRPPLEQELIDHTLWPEVAKLYGHGNAVACVAVSPDGRLVASACKARDELTARLRLWDTQSWRALGELGGHVSTVVGLAWSPEGGGLVSVGKDRQVCVYAREGMGEGPWKLVQLVPRAHKRIIWSVSWASRGFLLGTGSRDGTVKVWRAEGNGEARRITEVGMFRPGRGETGESVSVTALAFLPEEGVDGSHVLAVGLESGGIEIWRGEREGTKWACVLQFEGRMRHVDVVKRVRWRPVCGSGSEVREGSGWLLASAGADWAVKVAYIREV